MRESTAQQQQHRSQSLLTLTHTLFASATSAMIRVACLTLATLILCTAAVPLSSAPPTDNALRTFYGNGSSAFAAFQWSDRSFNWSCVVAADAKGDPAAAYASAAKAVLQKCGSAGGVVYFPAGKYSVKGNVTLVDGVLLRGASTGADAAVAGGGKAGK